MALQLAVGPLCFLTFRTATERGFAAGIWVALSVTLADALFVTLSGLGAAAALKRAKVRTTVIWTGSLVLCLFGLNIILGAFGVVLLPGLDLCGASGRQPVRTGLFTDGLQPADHRFLGRSVHRADCAEQLEPAAAFTVCRGMRAVYPAVAYVGRGPWHRGLRLPAGARHSDFEYSRRRCADFLRYTLADEKRSGY